MALKKDKEKVIDPVWDEARIREFLSLQPIAGENVDFHRLLKAYQSMRVEDFDKFVRFFVDAGGDLQAIGKNGKTLLDVISTHRHSEPYRGALSG